MKATCSFDGSCFLKPFLQVLPPGVDFLFGNPVHLYVLQMSFRKSEQIMWFKNLICIKLLEGMISSLALYGSSYSIMGSLMKISCTLKKTFSNRFMICCIYHLHSCDHGHNYDFIDLMKQNLMLLRGWW